MVCAGVWVIAAGLGAYAPLNRHSYTGSGLKGPSVEPSNCQPGIPRPVTPQSPEILFFFSDNPFFLGAGSSFSGWFVVMTTTLLHSTSRGMGL